MKTEEKTQHTKEPWMVAAPVHEEYHAHIRGGGSLIVNIGDGGLGVDEHLANARRIVAAVNGCESIPTKALEYGIVGELVEALEESADVLSKLMQTARIKGNTEQENYARHGVEVCRTAINKAKGAQQ